ncbi:hypothetical protein [Burkholderia cepacia]|uniref:hypothetical protein n=1 Tax=Burkholderia cepacia TaxID=292 RepID=UPI001F45F846|nr:hypothetical protein [Burkholderia cepacia]UIY60086.1 hypothetical protein LZ568_18795 [Burkholderia cepacia]
MSWISTGWGAVWSSCLWMWNHDVSWWVSLLTIVALLGTIKNQWFPKGKAE